MGDKTKMRTEKEIREAIKEVNRARKEHDEQMMEYDAGNTSKHPPYHIDVLGIRLSYDYESDDVDGFIYGLLYALGEEAEEFAWLAREKSE